MKVFGKTLLYALLSAAYIYISTSLLIFHGPWKGVTEYAIDSIAITRHAYLLRPLSLFTLSNSEITERSVGWTLSRNVPSTEGNQFFKSPNHSSISFKTVSYPAFSAQIIFIGNPKRIKVAVTKYLGNRGETVTEMTKENHAILGVNGGAFNDAHYRGTGGIPLGTTISDGKFVTYDPNGTIIGITAKGQLLCGTYTKRELESDQVEQAVTFGPILVQNGKGVAPEHGGWAPRVAIGQKGDGTILFIVTDGRGTGGINSLGATYQDIEKLMLQFGAVTAANLDGGSSTTLVYQNKLLNTPPDILGQRLVGTAFVVLS